MMTRGSCISFSRDVVRFQSNIFICQEVQASHNDFFLQINEKRSSFSMKIERGDFFPADRMNCKILELCEFAA